MKQKAFSEGLKQMLYMEFWNVSALHQMSASLEHVELMCNKFKKKKKVRSQSRECRKKKSLRKIKLNSKF